MHQTLHTPWFREQMASSELYRESMLEHLPKNAVVAEVGVATGDFSQEILKRADPSELHLIDYWKSSRLAAGATPQGFVGRMFGTEVSAWEKVNSRFFEKIESKKVQLHRGFSWEKLAEFEDEYFDWIYLDAAHDFDSVVKDLEVASKKLTWRDTGWA